MKKQHLHLTICFAFFLFFILQTACGLTPQEQRERFIEQCKSYLGTPYKYGGTNKKGMDCSGFIFTSAKEALGVDLPRRSEDLYNSLEHIEKADLQPGDLIFFKATTRINHAAVYLGNNTFIHSASDGPQTGVIISNLDENYWKQTYAGCAHFLPKLSEQEMASLLKGEKKTPDEKPEPEKPKTEEPAIAKAAEKQTVTSEMEEKTAGSPVVIKQNENRTGGGTKALRIEPRQESENAEEVAQNQNAPKAEAQTAPVLLKNTEAAAELEQEDEEVFTAVVFEKYSEKQTEPQVNNTPAESEKAAVQETSRTELADVLPKPAPVEKTENLQKAAEFEDLAGKAETVAAAQTARTTDESARFEESAETAESYSPAQNDEDFAAVSYSLPAAEPVAIEKIEEPAKPVQTASATVAATENASKSALPLPVAAKTASSASSAQVPATAATEQNGSHKPQQTVVAQPQLNVTISVEGFIY